MIQFPNNLMLLAIIIVTTNFLYLKSTNAENVSYVCTAQDVTVYQDLPCTYNSGSKTRSLKNDTGKVLTLPTKQTGVTLGKASSNKSGKTPGYFAAPWQGTNTFNDTYQPGTHDPDEIRQFNLQKNKLQKCQNYRLEIWRIDYRFKTETKDNPFLQRRRDWLLANLESQCKSS